MSKVSETDYFENCFCLINIVYLPSTTKMSLNNDAFTEK